MSWHKTKMSIKNIKLCVVLFLHCNISASSAAETDPIVSLPNGDIKGHVLTTNNQNTYYAFQEIPYASPPVGELRFKEPVPPKKWTGVLDTTKNTKICYQQLDFPSQSRSGVESEDCLYINVYTPLKPGDSSASLLPVLIWIHGGAFKYGDGSYDKLGPQFFIDHGLVIVTMNYRVGTLGFLTTEDGVIPGNLALKDQNLSLKWVNENIKLFGGDPDKVTVSGISAGAASAGYQLISEKSKGLFRAAILQSGNGLCSFAHQRSARYFAFEVGRALDPNFKSDNSTKLLELLQNSSASDIMLANVQVPIGMENQVGDDTLLWVPVIEDKSYPGAFITGPMHEDVKNGNINQVPTLLGFTSEEYISFTNYDKALMERKAISLDKNLSRIINNNFNMNEEDKYTAGGKLREIYTTGNFEDHLGPLIKLLTDSTFANPTIRHADLQSHYTDVYLYQFSHKGPMGQVNGKIDGIDDLDVGVAHAEDGKYMWSTQNNFDIYKFPVSDILTHKRIVKLWSNFVKYMNPTPEEDPLLQNIIWPKVTPNTLTYLNINTTLGVKTDPKVYKQYKEVIEAYAIPPINTF